MRTGRKPHGEKPDCAAASTPTCASKIWSAKDRRRRAVRDGSVEFLRAANLDFEVAMIRAYHRWLADYCAAYPARLKGVAIAPMRQPDRAAEEIRRVANEPWCVGIYLSAHMEDKLLDHPAFHPIWKACVDTDLPACFHGGTARPPYGMGTFEMGNNLFIQHSATNPFEVMRGIAYARRRRRARHFSRNCASRFLRRAWDGCRSGWSGSTSITS